MRHRYINTALFVFLFFALVSVNTIQASPKTSTATVTVSVTIVGGPLSIEATDLEFQSIDLSSGYNSAIAENTITVVDPTGTGAGWNVTLKASDLVSEDADAQLSLDELEFEILSISQNRIRGNTNTDNAPTGIEYRTRISQEELKLVSAARNTGMGRFSVTPQYQLTVPEDTVPGTYTSNLTYTIFQGP